MGHPYWPLFDLEVHAPRLTLRTIDDDLAVELVRLITLGIHEPEFMPFGMPWTRAESPDLEWDALRFYWRCRAETSPASWHINFAVIVDEAVVGSTGLMADDFARMRQFETGSWLGRAHQGQGIGKEMRRASLTLGFLGFGADWATTGAWHDNGPSLGVTRSLGYTEQGHRRMLRDRRHPDRLISFEMTKKHFIEHVPHDDIEIVGLRPVRKLLGLEGSDEFGEGLTVVAQ